MKELNDKTNSDQAAHTFQFFLRATIILTGFLLMVKICKVMVQDIKEMSQ